MPRRAEDPNGDGEAKQRWHQRPTTTIPLVFAFTLGISIAGFAYGLGETRGDVTKNAGDITKVEERVDRAEERIMDAIRRVDASIVRLYSRMRVSRRDEDDS